MTLRLGQTISHYKILEHIGEGGMGVIYRAFDSNLNRQVAVKALHTHLIAEPARRQRFMREALAAASLNHPYIATVHAVEDLDEHIFIVMEFVEGRTLRSLIKNDPLSPARTARIGSEIAEGLSHAHGAGIVHRDLKPENIVIRPDNHPKILDFGVAKVLEESFTGGGSPLGDSAEPLTREGRILGTVGYMSPEQARGEKVDARSDIFSFGIVLYEMLTGEAPFKGSTGVETLSAILKDEPRPVPEVNPDVPREMQGIVERCLKKSADDRFPDADALSHELVTAAGTTTISGSYAGALARKRLPSWAIPAVSGLAIFAIGGALWLMRGSVPRPRVGAEAPVEATVPAVAQREKIVVLPFDNLGSPDDAYFAQGMTEEITSRLSVASGLGVISRTSAFQYNRTGKSVGQIGEDLGVQYVLEGSVRWARNADGASRVRITQQLIRVADDTHVWADTFDREIDDIFQVQSEIAEKVIGQIGVVLEEPERTALESRPTENVPSYQAYLRGLTRARGPDAVTDEGSRDAVHLFQRAVELDPGFALAWAELARSNSLRYHLGYDRTEERRDLAREAVERATGLQPDAPEVRLALGYYHYWGHKRYDRALEEFGHARAARPNSSDVHSAIGFVHRRQGKWEEAIDDLLMALELNPIEVNLLNEIGSSLTFLRKFDRADQYLDRSLALASDQRTAYRFKALNELLGRGDTARARAVFEGTFEPGEPTVSFNWYQLLLMEKDYGGALRWLRSLPVDILQDQSYFHPTILLEALAFTAKGETDQATKAFAEARKIIENRLVDRPADHRLRSAYGIALAGVGEWDEGIHQGLEGLDLYPVSQDAYAAPERIADMARIYIIAGDLDAALEQIEELLTIPSLYSVEWIRLDPLLNPVLQHPGYAELEARLGG